MHVGLGSGGLSRDISVQRGNVCKRCTSSSSSLVTSVLEAAVEVCVDTVWV